MATDHGTPRPSLAARSVANSLDRDRQMIARDAQDIADAAARLARDPDAAIATGLPARMAQDMQQLLIRATKYAATQETGRLYEAEIEATTTAPS